MFDRLPLLCLWYRVTVKAVVQNGFDALIGIRLYCYSPLACSLQSLRGIFSAKADDTKAGAISLFRMGSAGENGFNYCCGIRSGLLCPLDHPGRCPFIVFLVFLRSMFRDCGESSLCIAPLMGGNAVAF